MPPIPAARRPHHYHVPPSRLNWGGYPAVGAESSQRPNIV